MFVHAKVRITHVLDHDACKYWPNKGEADRQTVPKHNCSLETKKTQFLTPLLYLKLRKALSTIVRSIV